MSKRQPATNHEIIECYEACGFTAEDAFNEARNHGYEYQNIKGYSEGAIAAGIGSLLAGVLVRIGVEVAANQRAKQRAQMLETGWYNKQIQEMEAAKQEQEHEELAREDNNE